MPCLRTEQKSANVNEADAVLDTSAIFCLIRDEAGANIVEAALRDARDGKMIIAISFASLTEVFYNTIRLADVIRANELVSRIKSWPVDFIYPDDALCLTAGEIKALFSLSFADAFIAATAREAKAMLVHKDPEFESLGAAIKQKPLPYKG